MPLTYKQIMQLSLKSLTHLRLPKYGSETPEKTANGAVNFSFDQSTLANKTIKPLMFFQLTVNK